MPLTSYLASRDNNSTDELSCFYNFTELYFTIPLTSYFTSATPLTSYLASQFHSYDTTDELSCVSFVRIN